MPCSGRDEKKSIHNSLSLLIRYDWIGYEMPARRMTKALPQRASPQLEQLQVKFAVQLPYAQAVALLNDVLPLDAAFRSAAPRIVFARSRSLWMTR